MKHNIIKATVLHAGYSENNADWNWKNVHSPFARLYYVTEGEAQIVIHPYKHKAKEDIIIRLKPDHLYFVPPFTRHSNLCTSHFAHYYIHVFENNTEDTSYLTSYDYPHEVPARPTDLLLFRDLCENRPFLQLKNPDPDFYDNNSTMTQYLAQINKRPLYESMETRGILHILMSRFIQHAKECDMSSDERIRNALHMIRSSKAAPISVTELANHANMSKDHFIRVFSKETGETPNDYITRQKIEQAELLLATTNQSVKSISAALGYTDCSYFNKVFKKNVGKSPLKYRNESF